MHLSHFLHLTIAGLAAASFDPAKDSACDRQSICLSSFVWCDKNDGSGDCYYPEGADPYLADRQLSIAVLYTGRQYEVEWRQASSDFPVLIEWSFVNNDQDDSVKWSTNTTDDSFTFDPQAILKSFPTDEAPGMSTNEAIISVLGPINVLTVSQPGTGQLKYQSEQFAVQDGTARIIIDSLKSAQEAKLKKIKLGVGIGFGLGVPILLGLVWFFARKTNVRGKAEL